MNWEAAEVGRNFPFPSGRRGDRNFPLCSQSQTGSACILGTDSWRSKAQTKSSIQVLLGGRKSSFIPSLQLQHCVVHMFTCCDKNSAPFTAQQRNQSQELLHTRKSALLGLPWKASSLKTSSPPSLQSLRNGNWRTFPSHSSFIFTHFQSHFTFLLVTRLGTSVAGPPPAVSSTCQVTHPKSTEQIKVYL